MGDDEMGPVPPARRAALREALDALVNRQWPELMLWVDRYPAQLIAQPEEIWEHPETGWMRCDDGSEFVVVPLWTVEESPSDLSAEVEISTTGEVVILDVHVL